MGNLEFRIDSVEVEGRMVRLGLAELGNAVLALAWEGEEPVLGSTTVTLPGAASTQLLGDRDQLLGRTLGGFLAQRTGKLALVSTHFSLGYSEALPKFLLDIARRMTEKK